MCGTDVELVGHLSLSFSSFVVSYAMQSSSTCVRPESFTLLSGKDHTRQLFATATEKPSGVSCVVATCFVALTVWWRK